MDRKYSKYFNGADVIYRKMKCSDTRQNAGNVVYALFFMVERKVYVGSTTKNLQDRLWTHAKSAEQVRQGKSRSKNGLPRHLLNTTGDVVVRLLDAPGEVGREELAQIETRHIHEQIERLGRDRVINRRLKGTIPDAATRAKIVSSNRETYRNELEESDRSEARHRR